MNHPILTATFLAAVISIWGVYPVTADDSCGGPCLEAGADFIAAAAADEVPATAPPSWMDISEQPEAGKFFQVRPQKGFRAITPIAGKARIDGRWKRSVRAQGRRMAAPSLVR